MSEIEVLKIAEQIQAKIKLLEAGREALLKVGKDKALAAAQYDKELAVTMLRLRSGKPCELGGEIAKDLPATLIEKIAKGICWQACYEKELAECAYKSVVTKLDSIKSELNGYQSMNKYLEFSTDHGRV
jgi:hypothetical protein